MEDEFVDDKLKELRSRLMFDLFPIQLLHLGHI